VVDMGLFAYDWVHGYRHQHHGRVSSASSRASTMMTTMTARQRLHREGAGVASCLHGNQEGEAYPPHLAPEGGGAEPGARHSSPV
jgi:hypothetical protein